MISYIPLPNIEKLPEAKAHPYPFKIWYQTEKMMLGSVFYSSFVDIGIGEFARICPKDAYTRIEKVLLDQGMSQVAIDKAWGCFCEYLNVFPNPVFQYSLYSMVIHWDWFISKLGTFIHFAKLHENNHPINKKQVDSLQKLGMAKIDELIPLLKTTTGLEFNIDDTKYGLFKEMLLVRNLGIHNEWEIDRSRPGYCRRRAGR